MDEVQQRELRAIQDILHDLPHIRHVYNPRMHNLYERVKAKQDFKDLDARELRTLCLLRREIAQGKYSEFGDQNHYAVLARRKKAFRQGVPAKELPITGNPKPAPAKRPRKSR